MTRLLTIAFLLVIPCAAAGADNLLVVTWDGFRWQELFGGAEENLINKPFGGVSNVNEIRSAFWREAIEERRRVLLPFIWDVVAKEGQIFGDPTRKAVSQITNGKKFSYPGYNEMFVGFADDRISSNDKVPNPNLNVLEFLNRQPGFSGRVAGFATWDVMAWVLNRDRNGLHVRVGWELIDDHPLSAKQEEVNSLVGELPRIWRGNEYDYLTVQAAREHLIKHKPRVMYVGLGETDEWAHARRYDLYLESAQRSDRHVRELWELVQSLPDYKGKTALVLTTDHGRGPTPADWTNHSATTPDAEFIWIAALGVGVPPLGVRENVTTTQSQVAATLAQLLDQDFNTASPQSAPSLSLSP